MSNRKRWASKEEARQYAIKAFHERRMGLSFWAACDYIGWSPKEVRDSKNFQDSLYADYLISMGKRFIKEEISDIKWEINNIQYVDNHSAGFTMEELESFLKTAQGELNYLNKRSWKR